MAHKNNTSINDLCKTIHSGGLLYIEEMRKRLNLFESDNNFEQRMAVYLECVFLFMCVSSRIAFNTIKEKYVLIFQKKLSSYMFEKVKSFFINELSMQKIIVDNMTDLFYSDLNDREIVYGSCKEFLPKEKPLTGNSISLKFASAINQIFKDNPNPEILVTIIEIISEFNPFNSLEEYVLNVVRE